MRFGIDVAQQRMPWDEIVSRVQFAEGLGFDGAWGFDHFQPMYGEGPGEAFDGMTTLAALAGQTSTIRLGLLVTGVTYRHPSVFAAQAVTVDHASHGRLELSLGAAWFDPEHHALGGYETWLGTNRLETDASEKMLSELLAMAAELKGK